MILNLWWPPGVNFPTWYVKPQKEWICYNMNNKIACIDIIVIGMLRLIQVF